VLPEIDLPISFAFDKVDAAINKLKNVKSPGPDDIPPEAYMAMNNRHILDFTDNLECCFTTRESPVTVILKSSKLNAHEDDVIQCGTNS